MLKMAVLAPMPSASVITAIAVNAGRAISRRAAYVMSRAMLETALKRPGDAGSGAAARRRRRAALASRMSAGMLMISASTVARASPGERPSAMQAWNNSSACSTTSSKASCSMAAVPRRRRTRRFQSGVLSGMADPGNARERADEFLPACAMAGENAAPLGGNAVIPFAPLAGLLDPPPDDQPALLEAVQHRIEGGDMKFEHAARALLDQLADLVAVAGAILDQGQDQDLGTALDVRRAAVFVTHMYDSYICDGRTS